MALEGFGNRLKEIRQERGYTQKQLANLLGVTEQAISKYERGSSYPDVVMLNGISEVLDCSLDYLFQHEPGKRNLPNQASIDTKAEINKRTLPEIITLQFGEKVIPLFLEEMKQKFPHVASLRQQIADQWGVVIPVFRMRDLDGLGPDEYEILINGISVHRACAAMEDGNALNTVFGELKDTIIRNIDKVLNNQCVYYMVENLRAEYPHVINDVVPETISYSKLRRVLVSLIRDYGYAVNPLILIIQAMEEYEEITDSRELAGKVAQELGQGFRVPV